MKLKTLKDLRIFGRSMGKTGQDNSWVFTQELKQEAIKHIKSALDFRAESWIMDFFNITDQDLKDNSPQVSSKRELKGRSPKIKDTPESEQQVGSHNLQTSGTCNSLGREMVLNNDAECKELGLTNGTCKCGHGTRSHIVGRGSEIDSKCYAKIYCKCKKFEVLK